MTNSNDSNWIIYGANGYTGELIAREAVRQGLKPTLAGRNKAKVETLAQELGLTYQAFGLDNVEAVSEHIKGFKLVMHCAGPFSATSKPMMEACIKAGAHYLDITGEISVFELAQSLNAQAQQADIVLCPGVGFDVIPTDCVAAKLKEVLPDATHLALGFDSKSGLSQGTAKTSTEGTLSATEKKSAAITTAADEKKNAAVSTAGSSIASAKQKAKSTKLSTGSSAASSGNASASTSSKKMSASASNSTSANTSVKTRKKTADVKASSSGKLETSASKQ